MKKIGLRLPALIIATGLASVSAAAPAAPAGAQETHAAPAFHLKDVNGATVTLSDYKGKVVLLDFWATWCVPCVAAIPRLQKLHNRCAPGGFAVVGIALDEK